MDLSTIVGIVAGLSLMLVAIINGGNVRIFLDLNSFMITIGGTIAATLVNYPVSKLTEVTKVLRVAFRTERYDAMHTISMLVDMSEKARREGLLALEEEAQAVEDDFLEHAIQLVIDGVEPEVIQDVLETEIDAIYSRHQLGQGVFETMGALAPAFGMIGTLIGLVQMLSGLEDLDKVGPGLSVALITTLYGAVLANLMFIPIAGKLGVRSKEEIQCKEMIISGVLAIQKGENPRLVRERLLTFVSPNDRNGFNHGQERGIEA
jgi:chemotaxis protein MotA